LDRRLNLVSRTSSFYPRTDLVVAPARSTEPGKPFDVISKTPRLKLNLPDMGLPTYNPTLIQLVARQGRSAFRCGRRTLMMQLVGPPSST
jgi:hypothetical protein